jgi:myo-inositol 2-dehydrogenase / D-chiro-inositol 1-dehydrogenase
MSHHERVKVGIIGSQFEADIHAESFRMMPDEAEVVAVASPTPGNAERFAQRHRLPRWFTDYRQMLAERDIEMITIAAPERVACPNDDRCRAVQANMSCARSRCV